MFCKSLLRVDLIIVSESNWLYLLLECLSISVIWTALNMFCVEWILMKNFLVKVLKLVKSRPLLPLMAISFLFFSFLFFSFLFFSFLLFSFLLFSYSLKMQTNSFKFTNLFIWLITTGWRILDFRRWCGRFWLRVHVWKHKVIQIFTDRQ